jgi:serine phosphatase RsbU (regulator of sigma subunit)/tetratricopeptide (TPR) repeat protein
MRKFLLLILIFILSALLPAIAQQALPQKAQGEVAEYQEELQSYLQEEKQMQATRAMNHIAQIYWTYSHYEKAIDYFQQSLEINEQIDNRNAIAQIHNNLAMLYNELGNYREALKHLKENFVYVKSTKDPGRIVQAYLNIATAQKRLKLYSEATITLEKALDVASTNDLREKMAHCYGELADLYTGMGDKEKAGLYYNLYDDVQNELYRSSVQTSENERLRRENAENAKRIKEMELRKTEEELTETKKEIKYISNRHKALTDSLDASQLALELIRQEKITKELENKQLLREKQVQKTYTAFAVLALLIVIGFLVYMWYSSRHIKRINNILTFKNTEINQKNEEIFTQAESLRRVKEEIETKHRQITSSIEYAQLIQSAVLNPRKKLTDYISNSFIWYRPRDVVSGDFYWYTEIDGKLIIAAGDCTGHGVPGGFLTMTGHNLLSQIIQYRKITDPAEVLHELETEFSHALHQDYSENMDGMDISVCVLDPKNKKLHFSGAKSPLVIIENEELSVLEPDYYSIGGISLLMFSKKNVKKFTTQTIDMPRSFSFYMHSDGPVDQFNQVDRKRLMKHGFYEMLKQTNHLPAEKQKSEIARMFKEWRGDTKQTDDILLIAGKIEDYNIR